jgi:hypothetical protein
MGTEINLDNNDIVRIMDTVRSTAGKFCYEHNITGTIVGRENGRVVVNCGIGYNLFVNISDLQLVAKVSEIPTLDDGGP